MTSTPTPRPPLDPARLDAALADVAGLSLELLPEAPSTNAIAADRARAGAHEGLLVVADHQTAGRGRLDRVWETPAGAALSSSLLLRPDLPPIAWPWLPLLTGLAVATALADLGWSARVKWPNDVLLDDRKVAGILVERVETATGPAAVIGVGINVSTTADELPVPTATSLAIARPETTPDRVEVLAAVVAAVRQRYDAWLAGDREALRAAYVAACATIGAQVRVDLPGGETLTGRASDVDADGRLAIETDSGLRSVGAGDVVHVRPDAIGGMG